MSANRRTRWRTRALGALLAALATSPAGLAHAGDESAVDAARVLFREGSKLTEEGRFREARDRYRQSLRLWPAPITHYNLGVVLREMGLWAEARKNFRAFLSQPPTPETRPFEPPARAAIAESEKQVASVRVVAPRLDEATVALDGDVLPPHELPGPMEVDPGTHVLELSLRGHVVARRLFSAAAGERAEVRLAPPVGTSSSGSPTGAPSRRVPFVLLASGSALFAAGLATGAVGIVEAGNAPARTGAEADSARAKGLVGDVLIGTGIAAAGVGVVLLLTQKPTARRPSGTLASPFALRF